ncbi:unnamed protein product [Alternaria burnsii]|nr:unnamed protein product [Alternaria burnsii]
MRFCFRLPPMKAFLPTYRYTRKKASRTSRKVRQTALDAQACEPTRTSPFLLLPRELRDHIYDYAFGSEVSIFTPPDLVLEAWPKGRKSENGGPVEDIAIHYPNTLPAYIRGLPLWLLTNKQICSEALSYFGTVRTFASVDYSQISQSSKLFPLEWKHSDRQTPLVFNTDVIRNVTILAGKNDILWKQSAFLEFLDRLDTKELDLRLECNPATRYYTYQRILRNDLYAWINRDLNTDKWGGRFRKVIISIATDCDGAEPVVDTVRTRFDQGEALARRLVGNVGTVVWGPFVFDHILHGNKIYKRSIVVDRKD